MSSEAVTAEPKVLRVALVGCGRISTYHIAALAAVPAVEIVAVCDLNEQIAREVATHHGIRGCYTDVEAMLREAHPDVMHILTPPQSHLALARVAVRYQVHLYIEKAEGRDFFRCPGDRRPGSASRRPGMSGPQPAFGAG